MCQEEEEVLMMKMMIWKQDSLTTGTLITSTIPNTLYRKGRGAKKGEVGPMVSLSDIKANNPALFRDIVQDVINDYDSVEDIPDELPLNSLSPDLRKRVASTLKAIVTNNALADIPDARLDTLLKHLKKSMPAEGEELITPDEAQELLDKAKRGELQLKPEEEKALKKIAMMAAGGDFEFEEIKLTPTECKRLDKALDLVNIDIEELKRDYPELYKELKKDIADLIAATGKVPKSIKASEVSPSLLRKLAAKGLIELDEATEELLQKKEEQDNIKAIQHAAKLRDELDSAVDGLNVGDAKKSGKNVPRRGRGANDEDDDMEAGFSNNRYVNN
jgi:hypothetical protein